jgi:SAM-dependent methyltransferase
MPKRGEINYVRLLGEGGARHAVNKPFSDEACGRYLADLGLVMGLLPPPPARVLDLGVGTGWTTVFLARRGYEAVGQDISADMIELANGNRERYAVPSASFVVQDYEEMPYREEFDAALFYDALHHAEDERLALGAVYAALKPGGICLTVEPGEGHGASPGARFAAEKYGVTERDMPPHHVIAVGRSFGFRQFRVYARVSDPLLLCSFGPSGPVWPTRPTKLRVAIAFLRKALRAMLKGSYPDDLPFLFRLPPETALRASNIVWMEK